MNKLGIRIRPIMFRIDDILKELVEFGLQDIHARNEFHADNGETYLISNQLNPSYWKRVVHFLSLEDVQFVLSFPQQGKWNRMLYEECEKKFQSFHDKEIDDILGL